MEISQCLEVLRKARNKDQDQQEYFNQKLYALSLIARDGKPGDMCYLTFLLHDPAASIREAACATIVTLFQKLHSRRESYESLRGCAFSPDDIDYYASAFDREKLVSLLGICSLNGNGYVRARAVKGLSEIEHPHAIRFLLYRLADWVLPIRQAALQGLQNYLTPRYLDALIESLPLLEWLQKVERTDLGPLYQQIITFLMEGNRPSVVARFQGYKDPLRQLVAQHLSRSPVISQDELRLLLSDRHFFIRSLALDHFDQLQEPDVALLLEDASAKVRLETFYHLKGSADFNNIMARFVADNSAAIRRLARYTLQSTTHDFAAIYHRNLTEGQQLPGSLAGLAEVGGKRYSPTVETFLHHDRARIRKLAFLALRKLDDEKAYRFGLENMQSPYPGLRNAVIDYLSTTPTDAVLQRARDIFASGTLPQKVSMLHLFHKIGGWAVAGDLMLGTIDENESLRKMSVNYLNAWRAKAVRLFTLPKPEETARAKRLFAFAWEQQEKQNYFPSNPLTGLDFFFQ
ncbi:HEAT repeat domain-containing protein [Paraflavisolibacter sp. H34]|uniref:HEAT repeat domain-containing protein n=1 Tax=Huijunlia imazamoxiresistens TaxID=3127457 RepID=UPI003016454D